MELTLKYQAVEESESNKKAAELIEWLRNYFSTRVNSRWIDERRCIPPYIVMDFARKGLFGFHVAAADGGLGLRTVDWLRVISQLGALDATISQLVAINGLGIRPYVAHGSNSLKQNVLSKLARGEILSCFAQTEDVAGTNFLNIETKAIKDSEKSAWKINGAKVWIGNAGWSGVITLIAQTLSADGESKGLTAFSIPTDTQGVTIGEELNTMGLRGVVQNRIYFKDVRVEQENVIGQVGDGMNVAVDAMSITRLIIAAQQLGLMKKAVQVMWKFMNLREISTGRLIDNAVAINFLSECIARIDASEALVQRCATKLDKGESVLPEISSICKIATTEFAGYVTDTALQMLGGRGYDENNIIPQLIRDTRVTRIFEGPTEALAAFVGSRIAGDACEKVLLSLGVDGDIVDNLTGEIEDQIAEIKSMSAEFDLTDEQHEQWLNYQQGILASWAVMNAAYCANTNVDENIQQWLETGYSRAPRFVVGDCFLSEGYIQSAIQRFETEIGDVQQSLPSLNWRMDDMLNR